MEDRMVHRIDLPAGPRPMSESDQRPEYVGRPDLFDSEPAKSARKTGKVDFGLQIAAPERLPGDFDPGTLGCAYGMHAANDGLTKLYQAYLAGDADAQNKFWETLERWAEFDPAPDYVVFHCGGTTVIPERLDGHRFDVRAEPEDIIAHIEWVRETYRQILKVLPQACVENVAKDQFAGPPRWDLGGEWLPMTYNEDRRGIWLDLAYIIEGTRGQICFDLEHGKFTRDGLCGEGLEYSSIEQSPIGDLTTVERELLLKTGMVYRKGQPVVVPLKFTLQDMITRFASRVVHVGGLHPAVVAITELEADNDYHRNLKKVVPPDVWDVIKLRQVASHASIESDDPVFRDAMSLALACGVEVSVVEVSSYGEGAPKSGNSPGCWYWQPPDALEQSFLNYCRILPEIMAEAGV